MKRSSRPRHVSISHPRRLSYRRRSRPAVSAKQIDPQTILLPLLAAALTLNIIVAPAVVQFYPAAMVARVGWFIAFFVFMTTFGALQDGKAFKVFAIVGMLVVGAVVGYTVWEVREPSKRLESACRVLQREMALTNEHAERAAAIFSAYKCAVRP